MLWGSALMASLLAGLASAHVVTRQTAGKPIFAHYMIGEINATHTRQDIKDAKELGIDAFALNFDQFASWSEGTVTRLFDDAKSLGSFKLFFSFDHGPKILTNPSQYADYVKKWIVKEEYFKLNGKAIVSTFGGEGVTNDDWSTFRQNVEKVGKILIIPGFYDGQPSSTVFNTRGALDGVFNWNSWPDSSAGKIVVPTTGDVTAQTAVRNAGKLFMMGISPVQFKHIDGNQNWYRRGEDNLEYRFGQALNLQPDMLQLQTWNDAGEGHYMGNLWPEPMTNAANIRALVDGYDHKGYWQVLPAFIKAWKRGDKTTAEMYPTNGKQVQGVYWHHTLTVGATCGGTGVNQIPKSKDITNTAEDAVSGIVLVAKGQTSLVAVVNVNGNELNKINLVPGYNNFKFLKLTPGKVQLEVWSGSTMVGGGYSAMQVKNSAAVCNYNFQVVGFPG